MPIEQYKLDAFLAWSTAKDTYEEEMNKIIDGRAACDQDFMKRKANELISLFNEYRRAWKLD